MSNQNTRPPVPVSTAQLVGARNALIRHRAAGSEQRDLAATIRDRWPPERLMQEYAEAWANGTILTVCARTGFSGYLMPGAREIDISPNATDETLGAAVAEVLSYSRELSLQDWYDEINSPPGAEKLRLEHYRTWRDSLMRRHGYKTQSAMYLHMLHVTVVRKEGLITFAPSNHEKLDAWSGDGLPPHSDVTVAADSPSAAVGAALRLTFGRCLDTYSALKKRPPA